MSGTEYGKDWSVWVGVAGSPETFVQIGGQTSLDWKTSTDKIDLASKEDGNLKASGFGQSTIDFTVQGKVKVPDAGLSDLYTGSQATPPVLDIQVKKGAIIKYQGQVGIGNFASTAANGDAVTYSFDMSATAVPTINNLMAAA